MYKKVNVNIQKVVKDKKRKLLPKKLKENVGKPKEKYKVLKPLGLPSKIMPISQISFKVGKKISFDEKTNNKCLKNLYANLALNLVNKISHPPNKFNLDSVFANFEG